MTEPVGGAQDTLRSEILNAAAYDWVPMIEVDQIIGAVRVKGPLTRCRRPAGCRIGQRDPLRLHRR